jgi:hypothetical protein
MHKNVRCKYHDKKRKFSEATHEAQIEYPHVPRKNKVSAATHKAQKSVVANT